MRHILPFVRTWKRGMDLVDNRHYWSCHRGGQGRGGSGGGQGWGWPSVRGGRVGDREDDAEPRDRGERSRVRPPEGWARDHDGWSHGHDGRARDRDGRARDRGGRARVRDGRARDRDARLSGDHAQMGDPCARSALNEDDAADAAVAGRDAASMIRYRNDRDVQLLSRWRRDVWNLGKSRDAARRPLRTLPRE